jgi:tetratricopeptide (TPR) repeat protein
MVDIQTGIEAAQAGIDLMNSNKFTEAEEMLKPWIHRSMYHSLANSTILFLQAVFSMEQDAIEKALQALNGTVALCNSHRKTQGVVAMVSSWVFGSRMETYTPAEVQAEVLFAESNLLLSIITFLQDEGFVSFVRGGLRIRSSYSLYKQLYQWLETCEEEGVEMEPNSAAGIRMGMGTFNLFLSVLPAKVMKLLEFIGFSGERGKGLQQLEAAALSPTFRGSLSTSFLLAYYTVAAVILGIGDMNTERCEKLLQVQLLKYPESAQYLYFKGRIELMKGNINGAIASFQKVQELPVDWTQIRHLCWWEIMWCHWLKCDWLEASSYAEKLYLHSRWSKSTFLYQRVSSLLMLQPAADRAHLLDRDPGEKIAPNVNVTCGEVLEMMRMIPVHKQRIAGKSLPIEKFAVAKSERYVSQRGNLPIAALEILYLWNGFRILERNEDLLRRMLVHVWEELMFVESSRGNNECYTDDWCVVTLVQGVCFRAQKRTDEAHRCFDSILERSSLIAHDHYVLAVASMELGLLYLDQGILDHAERQLLSAKNDYKGYHSESRINFKIHAGLTQIVKTKTPL